MRSSLAVAVGAALGASLRWGTARLLDTDGFPWATLVVNLLGCAVIGVLAIRLRRGTDLWYFAVTGVLGGLTTASTFAVETRELFDDGRLMAACAYVVVSVVGGLALASAGRVWAERASTGWPGAES